jgi:hypothetical protein
MGISAVIGQPVNRQRLTGMPDAGPPKDSNLVDHLSLPGRHHFFGDDVLLQLFVKRHQMIPPVPRACVHRQSESLANNPLRQTTG